MAWCALATLLHTATNPPHPPLAPYAAPGPTPPPPPTPPPTHPHRVPSPAQSPPAPAPPGSLSLSLFGDTRNSSLNTADGHAANLLTTPLWSTTTPSTDLRVFVDASVVEAYADGGRTVVTRRAYPSRQDSNGLALFAGPGADCTFDSVAVYLMSPI